MSKDSTDLKVLQNDKSYQNSKSSRHSSFSDKVYSQNTIQDPTQIDHNNTHLNGSNSPDTVAVEMIPLSTLSDEKSFQPAASDRPPQKNTGSPLTEAPPLTRVSPKPQLEELPKKPSLWERLLASLPPLPHIRKTLKASICVLVALVFVLDLKASEVAGGQLGLLVVVVSIFFFPVRTIGIQTEAVFIGVFGGALAAAWSFLGTYLAILARNESDPNQIQPGACAVLAVFLFFGTFALNLVRMNVPKANFGCVISCIVLTFTMTYSAAIPSFRPSLTWEFLRPILIAAAISLSVNYFIWPDDSINNFLDVLKMTLTGYNSFFKESSEVFLSSEAMTVPSSLPAVKARLQSGLLMMIDCEEAVKRELLYSRISDKDCSQLCYTVRVMRSPLHSIGLSIIMKNNYLHQETGNVYLQHFKDSSIIEAFNSSLNNIRPTCTELTNLLSDSSKEACNRLSKLHYHGRTALNSFLWPFPRLWVSEQKNTVEMDGSSITPNQVRTMIERLDILTKNDKGFTGLLCTDPADTSRNGPLYLLFLYLHNLRQHAENVALLLELIEDLETNRTKPRFWFPHQNIKKWLKSNSDAGTTAGVDFGNYESKSEINELIRVEPNRDDGRGPDEDAGVFLARSNPDTNHKFTDPDVSDPVTPLQKFFYYLYLFGKWLTGTNTFFALKTAVGVVLLAIPAWRPESAAWYIDWRGQWAMIILVLWMFPMTGAFIYGLFDRIVGSIIGAVLGIVVWEITQGNPYALAFVMFLVFIPFYYIFFFVPKYRVLALMIKITIVIVVSYEYGYVTGGTVDYDKVWTVAGKRVLLVIIGLAVSGILLAIPFPPSSRVALRKGLSDTIRDIGKAFGILSACSIAPIDQKFTPDMVESFGKLSLELRRQIAEERTLLHHSVYEPPLRGYFPIESYTTLVEKVDNMADLVTSMGHSLYRIRPEWRKNITLVLKRERKEYFSAILTHLKLISSTLTAKTALPPYIITPIESRQRVANVLEEKIMIGPQDIADPSFPSYSSYLMNSLVFVDELQVVLTVTEQLVGVEDPDQWLLSHM